DLPVITLGVNPASVLEDGTPNLVYTFTRTGPTTSPLTVNYTIGGTANASDYTGATPGTGKTITFLAGSDTATVVIDPIVDTTVEADETVTLTLVSSSDYSVGTTGAVTGTITNDDIGSTGLAISTVNDRQSEGDSGPKPFAFTVTRSGNTTGVSTVNWAVTVPGGAYSADASDFAGGSLPTGSLSFGPNELTKTITVNVAGDTAVENDEVFFVGLFSPFGASLTTPGASTTILNDDAPLVNGIPSNSGRDTLLGTASDDILVGGPGADTITTGAGRDVLIYTSIRDAGDRVTDFSPGLDRFDFSSLFNGLSLGSLNYTAATTGGYLKFQSSGANTILQIDADGFGPGRTVNFLTVENLAVASLNNSTNFIL
ncbi:MAG: Calx-beta domain-containing protein, partial [Nodosilinea sp.]